MFIKTQNRLDVIEALLCESLKDKTRYCNTCDKNYVKEKMPCCEDPQIGCNADHLRAVVIANDLNKSFNTSSFAASEKNTMRAAFELPPRIYHFINNYFKQYNEKFPKDKHELHALMRKFPRLTVPRKV